MDPAWPPGSEHRVTEYEALTRCRIHLLFRIDSVVDSLLESGAGFDEILREFDQALEDRHAAGVKGLKTIIAYRTGLAVDPQVDERAAAAALPGQGPLKRRAKPLRDFLLRRALAFASRARADACKMSQTLIAPTRTNVTPSPRLADLLSIVGLCPLTRCHPHRPGEGRIYSRRRKDTTWQGVKRQSRLSRARSFGATAWYLGD